MSTVYKNKEAAIEAAKNFLISNNGVSLSTLTDRLYVNPYGKFIIKYESNGKEKYLSLCDLVQHSGRISGLPDMAKKDIVEVDKYLQEYLDTDVTTLKESQVNTKDFYFAANAVIHYSLVTKHYLKAFITMKKIHKFYMNIKSKGKFRSHEYTYLNYSLASRGYYYSYNSSALNITDDNLEFEKVEYLTALMIVSVRAFLDSKRKLTRDDKSDVNGYIEFFKTEKQLNNFAKVLEDSETLSEFHSWIMNRKDVVQMVTKYNFKLSLGQYADPEASSSRYYNDDQDDLLLQSLITSDEGFIEKLINDVHLNLERYKEYNYRNTWDNDTYSDIYKLMKKFKKTIESKPELTDDMINNMKQYLSSRYGMGLRYAGIKGDVEAIRSLLEFLGCGEKLYDVVGDLPEKIQRYTITALIG